MHLSADREPGPSWELCIYVTAIKLGATNAFCIMISAECAIFCERASLHLTSYLHNFTCMWILIRRTAQINLEKRADLKLPFRILLCIILLFCDMDFKQDKERDTGRKASKNTDVWYVIGIISRWPAMCAISDILVRQAYQGENESNQQGGWNIHLNFSSSSMNMVFNSSFVLKVDIPLNFLKHWTMA